MPEFEKSRGFKMKGYSYPGESPLKGARKMKEQMAAKEKGAEAQEKWKEAMDTRSEGTAITSQPNPQYGKVPTMKRAPIKKDTKYTVSGTDTAVGGVDKSSQTQVTEPGGTKKTFGQTVKDAAGSEIGQTVGKAVAEAGVQLAVGALSKKKERPQRARNTQAGFSGIKIGRS